MSGTSEGSNYMKYVCQMFKTYNFKGFRLQLRVNYSDRGATMSASARGARMREGAQTVGRLDGRDPL